MRHYAILVAALLGVSAIVGCGGSGKSTPNSFVRVVHASPDAPNVDVLVDNRIAIQNLGYGEVAGYRSVAAGHRNIKVNAAGTSTTVIDAGVDLVERESYTVLAAGFLAQIAPIVLRDDRSAPPAGKVNVRVVHAAASAPEVDVYVVPSGASIDSATPVLEDVPFRAASGYLPVNPGRYDLFVTVAGTKDIAISANNVSVTAGQARTVIALDAKGGGAPFRLEFLADRN
ncbi:MAG TPA: DUF4397 domain-containing protein [Fimbriimonadaceae bacterium]|nr:DUF4397 domain-containing protein [Fimbriimonadaceae bacterium]